MSDHSKSKPTPMETPPSNKRSGGEGSHEGTPHVKAELPGTPQADPPKEHSGPNPGPGIMDQGQRVDEHTPEQYEEHDQDRKQQPSSRKDIPSSDEARDRDKDREDPLDEHRSGDSRQEQGQRNRH